MLIVLSIIFLSTNDYNLLTKNNFLLGIIILSITVILSSDDFILYTDNYFCLLMIILNCVTCVAYCALSGDKRCSATCRQCTESDYCSVQ